MAERLDGAGTLVELVTFPDRGHRIPWEEKKPAILRFLETVVGMPAETRSPRPALHILRVPPRDVQPSDRRSEAPPLHRPFRSPKLPNPAPVETG